MFPELHLPITTDIKENLDFVDKLDWEALHCVPLLETQKSLSAAY